MDRRSADALRRFQEQKQQLTLMKFCEKTGRRLRRAKYSAQGVHVSCVYTDLSWWHTGRKLDRAYERNGLLP